MTQNNIEVRRGDILAAKDLAAIVNPVNCVGVMGRGLALQFSRHYPQIVPPYRAASQRGEITVDRPQVLEVNRSALPRYVVNLATKKHWKNPSKLEWIDQGLQSMYQQLKGLDINSVGIPALGAGLGGLPVEKVRKLIETRGTQHPDVRTVLYLPTR